MASPDSTGHLVRGFEDLGVVAPDSGFYLAENGVRAFSSGVRYDLGSGLGLRIEGTRRESALGAAEHSVGIRGRTVLPYSLPCEGLLPGEGPWAPRCLPIPVLALDGANSPLGIHRGSGPGYESPQVLGGTGGVRFR